MTALKIGFHHGPGGNAQGLGDYFRALTGEGIPVFFKSVDHYGACGELIALSTQTVPHTVVFRLSTKGQGDGFDYDVPDYNLDPKAAATRHWQATIRKLPPEFDKRVWIEPINEVDKNRADWLGWFAFHIAEMANLVGYRVSLFGWSSGEPEAAAWGTPGMLRYLEYCGRFPAMAAVSLHEYSYNRHNIKDGYPYKIGRFTALFDACTAHHLPLPPVHITEWGWEYENINPDLAGAIADIQWANTIYAPYPQVKGTAIWYLGGGFGNIANQAQRLIAPVRDLALVYGPPDPEEPPPPPPPSNGRGKPRVQYRRIYVLIPSGYPREWQVAAAGSCDYTIGKSADDAGIGDLDNRIALVVNPEAWGPGEDGMGIGGFFRRYYPGVTVVPVIASTPAILAQLLPRFDPANPVPPTLPTPGYIPVPLFSQRDPRWGNISMGGDSKTIGNWGCLLVAYCSLANHWKLCTDTPDQFLVRFQNAGAMSGPNILPAALRTAFPTKVTYLGYESRSTLLNARIKASINRGIPVPTRVDFNPATGQWEQHWVLIVGYTDTDFIMADPWHGDVAPVSSRYNISGDDILEGIFYELATAPTPPPTGNARMGLHASADPDILPAEFTEFANLRPDVVKVLSFHSQEDIAQLAAAHPSAQFIVRAFISGSENGQPRTISPEQFVRDTVNDVQRALNALRGREVFIELHNEPNLTQEGMGGYWRNGTEFNAWLINVLSQYRVRIPGAKFLFPGLSPGGDVSGVRQGHQSFTQQCQQAIAAADGFALHAYWNSSDAPLSTALSVVDWYLTNVPNKPIWVTEASNNKGAPADVMATDYVTFWKELKKRPRVQGVTYYVASASDPAFRFETWVDKGLGAKVRARM